MMGNNIIYLNAIVIARFNVLTFLAQTRLCGPFPPTIRGQSRQVLEFTPTIFKLYYQNDVIEDILYIHKHCLKYKYTRVNF